MYTSQCDKMQIGCVCNNRCDRQVNVPVTWRTKSSMRRTSSSSSFGQTRPSINLRSQHCILIDSDKRLSGQCCLSSGLDSLTIKTFCNIMSPALSTPDSLPSPWSVDSTQGWPIVSDVCRQNSMQARQRPTCEPDFAEQRLKTILQACLHQKLTQGLRSACSKVATGQDALVSDTPTDLDFHGHR